MADGIGCLLLLIQIPILSSLFFAARYVEGIVTASSLGMSLGQPNMILVALAGLAYLAQGYIPMIGIPEEQKRTMRSMLIVSLLTIVSMSFSPPTGVALYWVIGGIFICIQSAVTNILLCLGAEEQVQKESKNNPPEQVATPIRDVTPEETNKVTQKTNRPRANGNKGCNVGKRKYK